MALRKLKKKLKSHWLLFSAWNGLQTTYLVFKPVVKPLIPHAKSNQVGQGGRLSSGMPTFFWLCPP